MKSCPMLDEQTQHVIIKSKCEYLNGGYKHEKNNFC